MIRIKQSDFNSLLGHKSYDGLYGHLMSISRKGTGIVIWSPADHTMYIRTEALGAAFCNLLGEWIRDSNIEAVQVPNESAPAAPTALESDLARIQRERREAKAEKARLILEAATQRLNQYYGAEQGLLDDAHNIQLLKTWFERNNAPFTVYNLDLAVSQIADLHWAAWAPRLQPTSEAKLIEGTNEPELPIDATESQMRKASVVQLKQLSVRRGEFRQRKGWSGSSFIEPTM